MIIAARTRCLVPNAQSRSVMVAFNRILGMKIGRDGGQHMENKACGICTCQRHAFSTLTAGWIWIAALSIEHLMTYT